MSDETPLADRPSRDDYADSDSWYNALFADGAKRLIDRGLTREEALRGAAQAMHDALVEAAPGYAENVASDGQEFVAVSAEMRREFAEQLRVHWGNALDLYDIVVSVVEQTAALFAERNAGESGARGRLLEALLHLNGQALRVSREIHALLSAGFPLGALALARTIHEIAVRAAVLAKFGAQDAHQGLAEKFLLHDKVISYKDARDYQRDAETWDYERLDGADLDEMSKVHDALIERFGKNYALSYGWAAGLPGVGDRPTFRDLEKAVALDHQRADYQWASHFVHADAKSLRLHMMDRGGVSAVLTNATNIMLSDPAQQALRGLVRVFFSLVTSAEFFSFYDQLTFEALRHLLQRADEFFVDGERAVNEAEARLQAELASRGLRLDIFEDEVPL